jgi:hypothetical protein
MTSKKAVISYTGNMYSFHNRLPRLHSLLFMSVIPSISQVYDLSHLKVLSQSLAIGQTRKFTLRISRVYWGFTLLQVQGASKHYKLWLMGSTQWLGSPDECPKTRYLAVSKPVKALKAGFDVSTTQAPCPFLLHMYNI